MLSFREDVVNVGLHRDREQSLIDPVVLFRWRWEKDPAAVSGFAIRALSRACQRPWAGIIALRCPSRGALKRGGAEYTIPGSKG